jgi:hypothetical protein
VLLVSALTVAIAVFLFEEEGRLGSNSAIFLVAFYALFVLAIEFYKTWAHSARVRLTLDAVHHLQTQLLEEITQSVHATQVGGRCAAHVHTGQQAR